MPRSAFGSKDHAPPLHHYVPAPRLASSDIPHQPAANQTLLTMKAVLSGKHAPDSTPAPALAPVDIHIYSSRQEHQRCDPQLQELAELRRLKVAEWSHLRSDIAAEQSGAQHGQMVAFLVIEGRRLVDASMSTVVT